MTPSFDAAIRFAADLIRIPSPPGGEQQVAERVAAEMRSLRYDDVRIDELGNVIGRVAGRGEAPPVMLSCHLDVVDAGDPAAWEHPPYGGVVEGGYLHGRGAMDIKGPLALQTHAAAAFVAEPAAGDVIVAHTVLEERGGWGMAQLAASGAVRPGAVIIGESTRGDICIGHRGRAELVVDLHGLAGHASAPERARNALDGVGPVLAALRSFGHDRLADEDEVLGRSTLVATDIRTEPSSHNVIPDLARIHLDWRILPGLSADDAVALLRDYLAERVALDPGLSLEVHHSVERQRTWTGVEQERRLFSPGFLLEREHPIALAAADAVAQATGTRPAIRPWAFATDGGHTCGEHGIPTIGFAPGEERYAHTNTERLELESASAAFAAYPPLIRAVMAALAHA